MAAVGIGSRTVVSLAQEISLHLLQPILYTTLASAVSSGQQTATLNSSTDPDTEPPTDPLYAGAQLLVGSGASLEVTTVIAVTGDTTFIASFANAHAASTPVYGATFPIQAVTDPLYTQSEILGYIARAQNQFLQDVPFSFKRLPAQTVNSLITTGPTDAVELERVAYLTGGKYSRLYATTQEDMSAVDPAWRTRSIAALQSWAEDRAGLYAFAVNGIPATSFTVEYLYSQRDTNTLAWTDGFLTPDICLHIVKYKALEFAWSKEGECRSPLMAQYCSLRYRRGVLAVMRWLDGMGLMPLINTASVQDDSAGEIS